MARISFSPAASLQEVVGGCSRNPNAGEEGLSGMVGGENLHVQFGITRDVSRLMAGPNLHLQSQGASTSTFLWTPIPQSMTLREATHVRGQSCGSSGVVDFIKAGTAGCIAIQ